LGANRGRNPNAVLVRVLEPSLQQTKKAFASRDAEDHGPQFAEDFVPFRHTDAFVVPQTVKNIQKAGVAMSGERQNTEGGVDNPTKDDFASGEGCIPFFHLAHRRHRLAMRWPCCIVGFEDLVDAVEEPPFVSHAAACLPLMEQNEVVDINVSGSHRAVGWR
jgi:hypothetical protein